MSQQAIEMVVHRLLTDEDLRLLFAADRMDALAELHVLGFELTPREIDLFLESDLEMWCWSDRRTTELTQ
jgi:hypothetical protein